MSVSCCDQPGKTLLHFEIGSAEATLGGDFSGFLAAFFFVASLPGFKTSKSVELRFFLDSLSRDPLGDSGPTAVVANFLFTAFFPGFSLTLPLPLLTFSSSSLFDRAF